MGPREAFDPDTAQEKKQFISSKCCRPRMQIRRATLSKLASHSLYNDVGSSLLETALSSMILFSLVFGIIETSMALYAYHFTAEAAREGTRYAIVRGSSCSSSSFGCPAQASDVQNYVRSVAFPGINSAAITVMTAWPTTGASCAPSSNPCNNSGNIVVVRVDYRFPLSIPFLPSCTLNMTSTSEMVISQ